MPVHFPLQEGILSEEQKEFYHSVGGGREKGVVVGEEEGGVVVGGGVGGAGYNYLLPTLAPSQTTFTQATHALL